LARALLKSDIELYVKATLIEKEKDFEKVERAESLLY